MFRDRYRRLIVNAAGIYQMCTFLFVKAVKVRNVLEVVGIEIAALYNQVGLYIIIKNCDLKIIALFSPEAVSPAPGSQHAVLRMRQP